MSKLASSFIVAASILGAAGIIAWAGPLSPPGGPVASTYKTLSEVEPRTAINSVNTPGTGSAVYRITAPGSYFLTGNLAGVSGKRGIEIAVSGGGPGVSIDLMGFELVGDGGSFHGISVTTPDTRNVSICNGTVRNWGIDGVDLALARNGRVTDLSAMGNTVVGIRAGYGQTVSGCVAQANGSAGIKTGDSCAVVRCSATQNTGHGFDVASSCTLASCTATVNSGSGINAQDSNTVSGCAAMRNSGNGIYTLSGSAVRDCAAESNLQDAISLGASSGVNGCACTANSFDGIRVANNCAVVGNTCSSNGVGGAFSGIFANGSYDRIEGNFVTFNDAGISAIGIGHSIIRNSASANTNDYSLPARGSFVRTIVASNTAMNAAANANVNLSGP